MHLPHRYGNEQETANGNAKVKCVKYTEGGKTKCKAKGLLFSAKESGEKVAARVDFAKQEDGDLVTIGVTLSVAYEGGAGVTVGGQVPKKGGSVAPEVVYEAPKWSHERGGEFLYQCRCKESGTKRP